MGKGNGMGKTHADLDAVIARAQAELARIDAARARGDNLEDPDPWEVAALLEEINRAARVKVSLCKLGVWPA